MAEMRLSEFRNKTWVPQHSVEYFRGANVQIFERI